MRKRKLLKIFGCTVLLDGMGSKAIYGATATAAASSSFAVSENLLIFSLTIFLAVVGWFIKTSFDVFRVQLEKHNEKIDRCLIELTTAKEGLRAQNDLIKGWHRDRKEIFDRLRHIESLRQMFNRTGLDNSQDAG
jgi:hypothetical protein